VTGIDPSKGPATGGIPVTLNGSGFTGATTVNFGPEATADFTSDSDTKIIVTSPRGTGTVNVAVPTPAGKSAANPAAKFVYSPDQEQEQERGNG
jgi:IPT/TIG domain